MAKATSVAACHKRHLDYQFDISDQLENSLQKARLEAMFGMLPKTGTILDIGCNGGFLHRFASPDCELWGVDICPELVERAKEHMIAEVAPAEKLPFDNKFFDVSILGEILEHVFDPKLVLREAARVTKKFIVGSTPHEKGNWGEEGIHAVKDHVHHVRCYTQKTLVADLSTVGKPNIQVVKDKFNKPQFYAFKVVVK